jgi:methyltransferase family protein
MSRDTACVRQSAGYNVALDPYGPRTLWSQLLRFVHFWRRYGAQAALGGAKAVMLRTLFRPIYLRIDRRFDQRYDLDTITTLPLRELVIDSDHFQGSQDPRAYKPTPVTVFIKAMAELPRDLRDYIFIDFGSGKGRILLLAQQYHFKAVVGIEFSRDLCAVARRNVAKYATLAKKSPNIELINGDAADYEIPDGPCVLYFFDPFGDDVMSIVLERAAASYRGNPRKLYFLYLGTRVPEVFDRLDFLKAIKRCNFAAVNGVIYETLP